jgi:hypothetical protein
VRRALPVLAAIAIAAGVAGCGSDSSGETTSPTVSIPAVTSPVGTAATATPGTTTSNGGVAPSQKTQTFNTTAPDSPTNDIPPPPGSPQAQFEQQCKQNPAACG